MKRVVDTLANIAVVITTPLDGGKGKRRFRDSLFQDIFSYSLAKKGHHAFVRHLCLVINMIVDTLFHATDIIFSRFIFVTDVSVEFLYILVPGIIYEQNLYRYNSIERIIRQTQNCTYICIAY